MPRKKSPTTQIIRALTGKSIDPLAEKAVALLIKRYRKNRDGGLNSGDSLKQAARDLFASLTGIRIPPPSSDREPRPARVSRNPSPPQADSELEHIARLKAELDRRIAARSKP